MCAVEGSAQAGTAKAGGMVPAGRMLTTLSQANDKIWYPQAQVAFSTATDDSVPVIADPSPPNGSNGQLGDLEPGFGLIELKAAADLCTQAWQTRFPGRAGIPLVGARAFFTEPATLGASPGPAKALWVKSRVPGTGLRGDALCGAPVRLEPGDIGKPFVAIPDATWPLPNAPTLLAHELGHNLFLGHGNGLDDNGDGRLADFSGARRYDEYCDPGWLAPPNNTDVAEDIGSSTPCSLMQRTACGGGTTTLRPLQIETARGVSRYLPGFRDGTPQLVVGSVG